MGVQSGATAAGAWAVVGALVAVWFAAAPADVGAPAALVGGATVDAVGGVDDVSTVERVGRAGVAARAWSTFSPGFASPSTD